MWKFVPNILTFARLGLTIIFLAMVLYSPRVVHHAAFLDVALAIFIVAGLTDVVDGHIARRYNAATKFGRIIDPLVDKVLVVGAFICFALIGEPKLFDWSPATLAAVQWLVVAILIAREASVTVMRHIAESRGMNFGAVRLGKIKMFVQSFTIGTVLVKMAHVPTATWGHWFTLVTFIIMVAITIASGLQATRRIRVLQIA
jgi:CDP-diacylglycerol--glycerol-3-phosphate 3-phosphatidyltransferase